MLIKRFQLLTLVLLIGFNISYVCKAQCCVDHGYDGYKIPIERFEGQYINGLKEGLSEYSANGQVLSTVLFEKGIIVRQRAFHSGCNNLHIESFISPKGLISFTVFYPSGQAKYKGVVDLDWTFLRLLRFDEDGKQYPPRVKYYYELIANEGRIEFLYLD